MINEKKPKLDFDNVWVKKSFGMCKHGYLLEAFKKLIEAGETGDAKKVADAEILAEKWAYLSMRALEQEKAKELKIKKENEETATIDAIDEIPLKEIF